MYKAAASLITSLLLLTLVAVPKLAAAGELVRAYVLVETSPDKQDSVRQSLGSMSNCLPLIQSVWHNELIAHIQCNDAESLGVAITSRIPKIDGVLRVTLWTMIKSDCAHGR